MASQTEILLREGVHSFFEKPADIIQRRRKFVLGAVDPPVTLASVVHQQLNVCGKILIEGESLVARQPLVPVLDETQGLPQACMGVGDWSLRFNLLYMVQVHGFATVISFFQCFHHFRVGVCCTGCSLDDCLCFRALHSCREVAYLLCIAECRLLLHDGAEDMPEIFPLQDVSGETLQLQFKLRRWWPCCNW